MALTLDATVGGPASNSYATVAAATLVADYQLGAAGWAALTADQKIQALVTATRDIDSIEGVLPGFIGVRATDTQALAWPRAGTDDYDDNELPDVLVEATIALALSYIGAVAAGSDVLNTDRTNGNVKRKKVDVLETEYFAPTEDSALILSRFPPIVQRLLTSLMNLVIGGWGSANVSRAT